MPPRRMRYSLHPKRGTATAAAAWDSGSGVIAKHVRMRVRHVDFLVSTDVPETFGGWLSQRRR